MKMTVFWDDAPCSLIVIALMMEAGGTSETSVNFYETTWCNIPEGSHLHPAFRNLDTLTTEKQFYSKNYMTYKCDSTKNIILPKLITEIT
jgi:hypothetical protein